ncbi:hypothetical protein [Streptomyces sp. 1222.5]|uniref:hypothetical protein n=1 Tax=Streptomyces sp. 1222.5 TaxID=1881026 RepID=UPI003D7120BC
MADLAYLQAGDTLAVGQRRRPGKDLYSRQDALNKAHARLRYPVRRGIVRLKTWRTFRKARCGPTWLTLRPKPPHLESDR